MLRKAKRQKILGVDYTHLNLGEQGDLFLTDFGVPWVECLLPDNFWTDREWFESHSKQLSGTSAVYRVMTKPVVNKQKEIVLKWNRMGQDIPGGTATAFRGQSARSLRSRLLEHLVEIADWIRA